MRPARARWRALRRTSIALSWLVAAVAATGGAQQNLGFEELDERAAPRGWSVAGGGNVATDTTAAEGARSLVITRTTASGVTRVTQRMPATLVRAPDRPRPLRLRLEGSVRTDSAAPVAAIWLRIDGARGPLFLDSVGSGREPSADSEPEFAAARSEAGWRRYEIELPFPEDVEEVAFGVSLRGEGTARFDGLELKPIAVDSLPPAAPAAARYIEAALDVMREHSLYRAEVDWSALRDQAFEYARGAGTVTEAYAAVRFAVRALGDRHSYLQTPAVTVALQSTAVSNARTGSAAMAPQGRQLGAVAYLQVPSFAGGTPMQQVDFAEDLKSIIQHHDEAGICGWVVDLRQNTGGNLWPMLAGLGPLLGDGELAASVYPGGRRVAVWHRDGQAGFGDYTQLRVRSSYRVRAATPVAVLVGPATASSAEVLAVAFRSRSATRSFGAPTRGVSAGNRTFALTDGASLVLTVAATSDRAGQVFTGPLLPDEPIAQTVAGSAGVEDPVLDAAIGWLTATDSCR
jgi:carboxyl-terminal processing protease